MAASDKKPKAGAERRAPLDRTRVIRAAVELIDEQGAAALSMRHLGRRLDVEAMSLYGHVDGRDNLLDSVIESIIDDLFEELHTALDEAANWSDYLVHVAHGVRASALAHPNVFPLIATRPPQAPWIRPPLRSLRWIDAFLTHLRGYGFGDDAAVYTYRAFTSFLLGHLLLEVAALDNTTTTASRAPVTIDLAAYPTVQELSAKLAENQTKIEFEDSLDNLLTRLQDIRAHGVR